MEIKERPICRNQSEIGDFIGVDKRMIPHLQEHYNLPVFKIDGKGNWKALKTSLLKWLEEVEHQFLKK
jgi:hypothetical protein